MKMFVIVFIFMCSLYTQNVEYIDSTKVRDPNLAWKISIIPGMGQLYNGKYLKALFFLSAEYYSILQYIEYKNKGDIGKRNTYAWWVIGIFIWNIIDSYVDAHLSTFPVKKVESNISIDSLYITK